MSDVAPSKPEYSEEKGVVTQGSESLASSEEPDASFILADKRLMRKIDFRLIPFLSLCYLLSFLDRTAIGNARLFGLVADLRMTDSEYLLCLTAFFISYAAFEVPSNVLLKKLRPSVWLPLIMVLTGVVLLAQGFVSGYAGLMTARVMLGVVEAGLFPGVNYYLSHYYKKKEFGLRAAFFFSAATGSGAFGGLLSAAIGGNLRVGIAPWAWIFVIFGAATIVTGLAGFYMIVDFPSQPACLKFLTEEERDMVITRLTADAQYSAAGEEFSWGAIWTSLADWKTWCGMAMYMSPVTALYAFSLFIPSILNSLGFSSIQSNLLSVPVYVFACILTVGVGFMADRYGHRIMINLGFLLVGGAGYLILVLSRNASLSYFAIYLASAGIFPLIPNTIAILSGNTEGSYKRAVTVGIAISWGNLNGAVASNIYRADQRPWYPLGHGIVLAYIGIGLVSNTIYYIFVKRHNAAKLRGEHDEAIGGEPLLAGEIRDGKGQGGWFPTVEAAQADKGDHYSTFIYGL